jgi:hypothetical protein
VLLLTGTVGPFGIVGLVAAAIPHAWFGLFSQALGLALPGLFAAIAVALVVFATTMVVAIKAGRWR